MQPTRKRDRFKRLHKRKLDRGTHQFPLVNKTTQKLIDKDELIRLTPAQIKSFSVFHDLAELLSELVPAAIATIEASGGMPSNWETFVKDFGPSISERGDQLIYPKHKDHVEWNIFLGKTVVAIAGLSFYPGGIRFCGWHYTSHFGDKPSQISKDSRYFQR